MVEARAWMAWPAGDEVLYARSMIYLPPADMHVCVVGWQVLVKVQNHATMYTSGTGQPEKNGWSRLPVHFNHHSRVEKMTIQDERYRNTSGPIK